MPHQDRIARPAAMPATAPRAKAVGPAQGQTSPGVATAASLIDGSPYIAAQRQRIDAVFGPAAKPAVAQRRLAVRLPDGKVRTEQEDIAFSAPDLHDAILAHEPSLLLLECKDPRAGQTVAELRRAEAVLAHLKRYSKLEALLARMRRSDVDHGTIDLRDPQHLALFYFQARRELILDGTIAVDGAEGVEIVRELKEGKAADEAQGAAHRQAMSGKAGLPPGDNSFPVAILGAGASVAYYLATAGRSLDPASTVIIGETQPWAGERGSEGVVNHPLHMIAPDGYQGRGLLDAGGGLAPRRSLSERIAELIRRWPNIHTRKILKVERHGSGEYFTITTADGPTFHARKVIAGLGIGKHKEPDQVSWAGDGREHRDNKTGRGAAVPRMIDMDRFQRAMVDGELTPGSIRSIAVVGPNAAIDVMSTVLRRYPDLLVNPIYWITGTDPGGGGRPASTKRPAFLKGTDNEYVEGRYDEVMKNGPSSPGKRIFKEGVITVVGHDYLAARVGAGGVALDVGARGGNGVPQTLVETLQADLVVYGIGPDVNAVSQVFGISERNLASEMEPVYDKGLHFNQDAGIDSPQALFRYLIELRPGSSRVATRKIAREVFKLLADTTAVRPGKEKLETGGRPPVVGVRLKPHATGKASLEVIGGTAYRFAFAGRMPYRYVSTALEDVHAKALRQAMADRDRIDGARALHRRLDGYVDCLQKYLEIAIPLAKRLEASTDVEAAKRDAYWRGTTADWLRLTSEWLPLVARKVVDGDERKILGRMRGTCASLQVLQRQLEALYDDATTDKYASLASSHMGAVSSSLPKNVVLGDQLTAARSSVEALQSHVPPKVAEGVNLVTSDHTTIAAYLAAAHGDLPPQVADLLTSRVVIDRRHAALDRAPLPRPELEGNRYSDFQLQQQSAFQSSWMRLFEQVNALFKSD